MRISEGSASCNRLSRISLHLLCSSIISDCLWTDEAGVSIDTKARVLMFFDHTNVHDLKSHWYPWAMLIWMPCTPTWDHGDIHGPEHLLGSCLGPCSHCIQEPGSWSELFLETIWRLVIHVPADCEEQGSYFSGVSIAAGTVEREGHRKFLWHIPLEKEEQSRQKVT